MKLLRIMVPLLWLLVAISGCVIGPSFQPPKLSVVNVSMVSADVFSQQFRFRLHVQNPNERELPIKGIEYELYLQGDSFAAGTSADPFVVPAHGDVEFDTVVSTNFMSSIVRLLSKLNERDGNKVQYNFTGKVQLSKGLLRNIPFNEQGIVDLNIKK